MTDSIEARVARGAEWLDQVKPGWERLVDLFVLDLGSDTDCVLGQIFAAEVTEDFRSDFDFACMVAAVSVGPDRVDEFDDLMRGFIGDCRAGMGSAALAECWIQLIKARHDTGALSDLTP